MTAADAILRGMDGAIGSKRVTYDFARQMDGAVEIKCSEFGDNRHTAYVGDTPLSYRLELILHGTDRTVSISRAVAPVNRCRSRNEEPLAVHGPCAVS